MIVGAEVGGSDTENDSMEGCPERMSSPRAVEELQVSATTGGGLVDTRKMGVDPS